MQMASPVQAASPPPGAGAASGGSTLLQQQPQQAAAGAPPPPPSSSSSPKRKRGRSSISDPITEKKKKKNMNMTKTVVMPLNSPTKIAADELEGKLYPTQQECAKLASVIRMLDKHDVGTERLPEEAGVTTLLDALEDSSASATQSLPLVDFYLDLAVSASKRRLRGAGHGTAAAAAATESTSSPGKLSNGHSHDQRRDSSMLYSSPEASTSRLPATTTSTATTASIDAQIDQFAETIRTILDELKDSAAKRTGVRRVRKISTPKYALHRTLGDYDVFSSASDVVPDNEKAWKALQDTDVLALYPVELATQSTTAQPRLSDLVMPQPILTKRTAEQQPHIEPVAFLYYDAYQSFAPTYDSSLATLSYAQSVAVRDAREAAEAWAKKELPPLPPVEAAGEIRQSLDESLANLDPQLFSTDDVQDLRHYLRNVEDSQVIDQRLQENSDLLRVLQEAQWARLRQAETTASQTELESAKRLLASLTSLANARPRTPDLTTSSPWVTGTEAAARIVQRKARPYYGTLDRHNYKGIPDYVMARDGGNDGPEGAGGSAEMGRKNSNQGGGGKKIKRSHKSKAQQAAAAAKAAAAEASGMAKVASPTPPVKTE